MREEQKTVSPEEALAILEEAWSYYVPAPVVVAETEEDEPQYIPYAA